MVTTYEDRYREELSDIFSRILKIDTYFGNAKKRAKSDFEKGLISEEVYNMVSQANYHTVLDGEAEPYAISEEDRAIVLRFASLTEDGSLYLSDINDSFNDLVGRMDSVANSVKTYFHYYDMDIETLKKSIIDIMLERYREKKMRVQLDIDVLKEQLDGDFQNNEEYKALLAKYAQIEEDEKVVCDNVNKASYATLMEFIHKKFSLVENYYKWFRVRKNKEDVSNGLVDITSFDLVSRENELAQDTKVQLADVSDIDVKLKEAYELGMNFAMEAAKIDNNIGMRLSLSPKYSKQECFLLFDKFYGIAVFFDYCTKYAEEGKFLSSDDVFNKFYASKFGELKSVDPNIFRAVLIEDVINYYASKANKYKSEIEAKKGTLDGSLDNLMQVSSNALIASKKESDILMDLNDDTDYLLGYVPADMQDLLYESLKEYLVHMKQYGSGDTQFSKKIN